MAEKSKKKSIARYRFKDYQKVAEQFYQAANDSRMFEYYTAAGVLIVHAAIAYADALCIKLSGVKSAGDKHEDAITLVESCVADSGDKVKALNQLSRIIEEKTRVSYLGELYTSTQTEEMWKRLERFRKWALDILQR